MSSPVTLDTTVNASTQPATQSSAPTDEELASLMKNLSITTDNSKTAATEKPDPIKSPSSSLGQQYLLLLTEQLSMKDAKAKDLHAEIQGITEKTKAIDSLLNVIIKKSQASSDGSVDCKSPDIVHLVEDMRQKGITISLPNGKLKKEDISRTFSLIGNQRQTFDQKMQEKVQAFQQGTMERNQLFEFIKGQFDTLNRAMQKLINGIAPRSV